ncbi:DUF1697 domain-containing protein [Sanguibacter sp. HDW7]|uniref:DUF1697 domain-containing protein n=1 Tax=Sanguibacter sp. HDW7 TaxID=2714931 RepID=UPI00140C0DFA|nr:DUF1697 domain-containing protein [Sanguibacter sp. HDW7]QIK83328.1 DUF1697 domain-containing protein [Sanguibacter sp. HDW7]
MPAPELDAADVRLAALLRGVNVGGRNIQMYELRDTVGALDVRNVRTVLASGNVLLDAAASVPVPEVRARLEQAIGEHFEYEALVAVVPLPLVAEIVEGSPWPDDDAWHTYVAFSTEPGLLREATTVTEEQVEAEAEAAAAAEDAAEAAEAAKDAAAGAGTAARVAALPGGITEPGAPAPSDAPAGTRLAEVRARASSRRTLAETLAANEAAAARVTELRERTGRTEVCSVVAASFLVGGAERDEANGDLLESWQHPSEDLAARLAEIGLDVLWWRCPRGSSLTTPLARTLARSRFSRTTTRNVRTLRRFA